MLAGDGLEELSGDDDPDARPDIPPDVDNLAQRLAQLLTALGARQGERSPFARERIPDYKCEFGHQKIPSYSGDIKSLKAYKQEVSMMLALCSAGASDKAVPHLVNAAAPDFKKLWFRGKYDVSNFDGPGSLERFYAVLKAMAGVQPVDELYDAMIYYLQNFKMNPQESIQEYITRETTVWEQLQEAVALIDGREADVVSPIHDQLRGMLLLRRSAIPIERLSHVDEG